MTAKERFVKRIEPLLEWCDEHPRVGWYIATMASLNVVLNLLSLFFH